MRETWASLEWELSILSSWGSRHFLTCSPSPLQEKLQLRRPLLALGCTTYGVGWQESQTDSLTLFNALSVHFSFLQWWAGISLVDCYVPTKTLSSMGVSLNQHFPAAPNSSQDRLELVHGSLQAPELEPHCWGYTWKNWKPRFKHIPVHQCS